MIEAGVNPFALDLDNETQYDYWNVSVPIPKTLTSDFYFSTTSLPCESLICKKPCAQDLPAPWYYNNGRVVDFKITDKIGIGAGVLDKIGLKSLH